MLSQPARENVVRPPSRPVQRVVDVDEDGGHGDGDEDQDHHALYVVGAQGGGQATPGRVSRRHPRGEDDRDPRIDPAEQVEHVADCRELRGDEHEHVEDRHQAHPGLRGPAEALPHPVGEGHAVGGGVTDLRPEPRVGHEGQGPADGIADHAQDPDELTHLGRREEDPGAQSRREEGQRERDRGLAVPGGEVGVHLLPAAGAAGDEDQGDEGAEQGDESEGGGDHEDGPHPKWSIGP